eukprot:m.73771 g.73771  ORF g.73771 m.73771 type:complete len:419 (+) comp13050_c0_seq4:890-2146(+)
MTSTSLDWRPVLAAGAVGLAAGWLLRRLWDEEYGAASEKLEGSAPFLPFGQGYIRSLRDVESEAAAATPDYIFKYFQYTCDQGIAAKRTQEDFERMCLHPRVLRNVATVTSTVQLFGQEVSAVGIAPTGFHGMVCKDAERATARAATARNSLYVYNYSYANADAAEVAALCKHVWVQIYLFKDRALARQAIQDAERLGFAAIVLTVDHPHDRVRDVNMPLFDRDGDSAFLSTIRFPNSIRLLGSNPSTVGLIDPALGWEDVRWLASQTRLPVVLKGITCAEDALLALAHGARGLIVSNHGGRQFDGAPSPIASLPAVVAAVAGRVPVIFDSGIRSSTQVTKALACGATAVLVGRPVLWGLAAHGQAGVEEVLEILQTGLTHDLRSLGCTNVKDLPQHAAPPGAPAATGDQAEAGQTSG